MTTRGVDRQASSHHDSEVDLNNFLPFQCEPLIQRFVAYDQGRRSTVPWIPTWVLLAGLLVIFATEPGGLELPLGIYCRELYQLQPSLHLFEKCGAGGMDGVSFTLHNDPFLFLALLFITVTPRTAAHQWDGYGTLASHMSEFGSMRFDTTQSRGAFNTQILLANIFFQRLRKWSYPILGLSLALTGVLLWLWRSDGAFSALAPATVDPVEWSRSAYAQWWMRIPDVRALLERLAVLLPAAFGLYTVMLQNVIGPRILFSLWRARGDFEIGADHLNADGYFGWLPVRKILSATYVQIVIHGIALAAIGVTLPPNGAQNWTFIFLAGQWVVTLPLYVLLPVILTRRKMIAYKSGEISTLQSEVARVTRGKPLEEKLAIEHTFAQRIQEVRQVPSLPYARPRDGFILVTGLIADLAAVVAVASNFVTG